MHYLDNSATTQVCPEAAVAALDAMTNCFGNPSSTHTAGRDAKKLLDRSRAAVAKALGCRPEELVFTSCARTRSAEHADRLPADPKATTGRFWQAPRRKNALADISSVLRQSMTPSGGPWIFWKNRAAPLPV